MKAPKKPTARKAKILARRRVYDGVYKLDELEVSYRRQDGGLSRGVRRLVLERGDSAAALLVDPERACVILTEQLRVPTLDKGPGWLVEMPAGSIDEGETPEACIIREIREEIGYAVESVEPIACFYPSPGASSERVFLFYAEVSAGQLVDPGATGLAGEDEDVRRVETPLRTFHRRVAAGEYQDAKLLLAAYWLKGRRRRKPRAP